MRRNKTKSVSSKRRDVYNKYKIIQKIIMWFGIIPLFFFLVHFIISGGFSSIWWPLDLFLSSSFHFYINFALSSICAYVIITDMTLIKLGKKRYNFSSCFCLVLDIILIIQALFLLLFGSYDDSVSSIKVLSIVGLALPFVFQPIVSFLFLKKDQKLFGKRNYRELIRVKRVKIKKIKKSYSDTSYFDEDELL